MATQGPLSPATTVDDATFGTVAWTNPNNAQVSDGVYATIVIPGGLTTHYLKATNFGFAIPVGATINGILVEVQEKNNAGGSYYNAQLVRGGSYVGTTKNGGPISTTIQYLSTGGSADLWGTSWTVSDINDSAFGVGVHHVFSGVDTYSVDHIRITVYYTEVTGATMTGIGSITGVQTITL